jgi:hypothetical protein
MPSTKDADMFRHPRPASLFVDSPMARYNAKPAPFGRDASGRILCEHLRRPSMCRLCSPKPSTVAPYLYGRDKGGRRQCEHSKRSDNCGICKAKLAATAAREE